MLEQESKKRHWRDIAKEMGSETDLQRLAELGEELIEAVVEERKSGAKPNVA